MSPWGWHSSPCRRRKKPSPHRLGTSGAALLTRSLPPALNTARLQTCSGPPSPEGLTFQGEERSSTSDHIRDVGSCTLHPTTDCIPEQTHCAAQGVAAMHSVAMQLPSAEPAFRRPLDLVCSHEDQLAMHPGAHLIPAMCSCPPWQLAFLGKIEWSAHLALCPAYRSALAHQRSSSAVFWRAPAMRPSAAFSGRLANNVGRDLFDSQWRAIYSLSLCLCGFYDSWFA